MALLLIAQEKIFSVNRLDASVVFLRFFTGIYSRMLQSSVLKLIGI
jgi:hypothetical protein